FGVLLGRLVCGFLCPFGLIQDLLYKLPVPKVKIAKKIDKPLRWTKYVIAAVMVIILPIVLTNDFGIAPPYFCQWLCPVGTLEGGIPLILTNKSLRASLGFLFNWKMAILLVVVGGAMFVYRPFCKYFCPLGAFYSLFNKISFYKMNVDKLKCNGCRVCEQSCKMNIEITKSIDSLECIRCGECKKVCKQGAITSGFPFASMCSDTEIKGEERSG
ncbi:MAG: 4Fe-4S binding protein, partial [Anaerovoracaceae bacterium]